MVWLPWRPRQLWPFFSTRRIQRSSSLCEDLKTIFYKLAANAVKFSLGASSNRNESLNTLMDSKAPKSRCYSRSASADYRFACVVGHKNLGETYTQQITDKLQLSPGKLHSRHIARTDRMLLKRRRLINTHAYKQRRAQQKKFEVLYAIKRKTLKASLIRVRPLWLANLTSCTTMCRWVRRGREWGRTMSNCSLRFGNLKFEERLRSSTNCCQVWLKRIQYLY